LISPLVTVHEPKVTNVWKSIERRSDFPDASLDQTDARNSNSRIDDAPALCSDGGRRVSPPEDLVREDGLP
jgi:hypothetical protein